MKRLVIIGASGHGKVVADIAKQNGYDDIVFLDNDQTKKSCLEYPVLGNTQMLSKLDGDVFVAIGNTEVRKKLMENYTNRIYPILVHPKAVVAEDVSIGEGTVIMAGAVVNSGAVIGKGCIVNTCSSVDHDCVLEDYIHVSVGAHLCGTVRVAYKTWIGAGAIVSNNINICKTCMIGAGSVVVRDIKETGTYIGVPARIISQNTGEQQ